MVNHKRSFQDRSIVFGVFCAALLMFNLVGSLNWAGAAEPAASQILKVAKSQFGTATSAKRAGFTKVTTKEVFTPEKGYGFQSAEGLMVFDRGGSEIVLPKDEYTASVYGAFRTTSEITCALVEGTSDNAFVVAMPDGEYTV